MEYTIEQLKKDGWNPSFFAPTKEWNETAPKDWWEYLSDDSYFKKYHKELETPDFYITKNESFGEHQYQIHFQEPKDDITEYGTYEYYSTQEGFLGINVPEKHIGKIINAVSNHENADDEMGVYSHFKMHQSNKSLAQVLTFTGLKLDFVSTSSNPDVVQGDIYETVIFKKIKI